MVSWLTRASTNTIFQMIKMSSPTRLTLRSSSKTHVPSETTRTHEDFRTKLLEAIVVASGPAFRRRLGCISSCTDEVIMTRHDEYLDSLTTNCEYHQFFEPREVLSSERRILSSKSPTSQRCASAIYLRMSVTQPNPDIRPNKSLPRINQTHSQTTVVPLS
ncbi:hypothetical protein BGY98DRAFT_335012 [Russula aff. rugulosa BPL654]|nr:hypothetical protein BGY98DRAFT_335012 [Russula aff. rugulosa BPL654]